MTIKQEKFNLLLNKYKEKAEIVPIPCAGLMEFIEDGVLSGKELEEYLEEKLSLYNKDDISSIVLGCTHYPFVKDTIAKIVGSNVAIIDGGEGTAREIRRRLKEKDLLNSADEPGKQKYFVSDSPDGFQTTAELFLQSKLKSEVRQIKIENYGKEN